MADLSAIKLPNGTTYTIKDTDGRKEAYLDWGGRNLTGNVTPIGMSLSTEHSANRIAYLNPAAIQIEYTTNGGSTWTDSGYTNDDKMWLCTGSSSIAVGQSKSGYSISTALTTNHWTRITLTGQDGTHQYVYTSPRKLLVNVTTAVSLNCLIEYKTGVSGASWQTFGTYAVSGWSGWNDIPLILSTFGGGSTRTGNYWYLRFTFKVASTRTDSYKGHAQVLGLRLFGATDWGSASNNNNKGPIASTGHLYSYDVGANATFPAKVTANGGFSGALTGNVTGTATGNLTSVQYDSTNAKLTYTKNGSNTDIVTVATLKSALGSMPASDVYNWAKANTKPTYTASEVGAAAASHTHGNITNGGDITATAPTIASGDQIIINDNSASKVTNGPTFDGSTTTTALTPKGTWENFSKFSGSYNDLTNKPTIPSAASLLDIFYPVGTIYETTVAPEIFNPNTAWGGEWTQIKDKFLLSAGDTYPGGSSGGSSDAVVPYHHHSVSITSKGMSANASHSHKASNTTDYPNFLYSGASIQSGDMGSQSGSGRHYPFQSTTTAGKYWAQSKVTGSTSVAHTHNVTGDTGSTGVDTATVKGTNMPPYLVVYMWKRIA